MKLFKKIGIIFIWILSILFLLISILLIFNKIFSIGLFILLAGIVISPYLNKFLNKKLENKVNNKLIPAIQFFSCTLLLLFSVLSITSDQIMESSDNSKINKPAETIKTKKEAEKEKIVKKMTAEIKVELKKTLDKIVKDYDISEYEYSYYVNNSTWVYSNYKDKEKFFNLCAQYGNLIYPVKESKDFELLLARTKIKSYNNGEVLGEYSVWGGYKFK
jgi:predicted membrane protein